MQKCSLVRRMELEQTPSSLSGRADNCLSSFRRLLLEETRSTLLNGRSQDEFLDEKRWTSADLDLHLRRHEALRRFAHQQFAPGLEERFLKSKGSRDLVIYSMLRVGITALRVNLGPS